MNTLPRVLDFFAGSGLVSVGLEGCCQTVWANDFCPQKAAFFRSNHPNVSFLEGSITEVSGASLPEAEISWASFPCQDLSLAGNRGGLGSSRSGLFWEWLRVLDESPAPPKVLAIENVVGLLTSNSGEDYQELHQALVKRGYRVGPMVINSWHWVPQSRPRLFIVAVKASLDTNAYEANFPNWLHPASLQKVTAGLPKTVFWNLLEPSGERKPSLQKLIQWDAPFSPMAETEKLLSLVPEKHRKLIANLSKTERVAFPGYRRTRHGQQVLELRFDDLAGCLRTAKGGSSRQFLLIWDRGQWKSRLLTTRETARLMGAPDSYQLSKNYNESYNAMGDAVAVPVAKFLAEMLLAPLSNCQPLPNATRRRAPEFCLKP